MLLRKYFDFLVRPISHVMIFCLVLYAATVYAGKVTDYSCVDEYMRNDDLDRAEAEIKNILSKDDKDVVALTTLCEIYIKKGEKGKALNYIKKAVRSDPLYPLARFYLGRAYFANGDFDNAAIEFDKYQDMVKVSDLEKDEIEAYVKDLHYIGHIYLSIKKYSKAYSVISEVLKLSPEDQAALYNMGIYYYHMHNRSQAYKYFSKAAEISKTSSVGGKASYAMDYMRSNPDSRFEPDFSFLDSE